MTTQQKIQGSTNFYLPSCRSHHTFDFSNLCYGKNREGNFLDYNKGITFEDKVGDIVVTGNELLYYPALAHKMRNLNEYPTLKRTYAVDKDIQGIAFIEYFYNHVKKHFDAFQEELATASSFAHNLIDKYGARREIPIVTRIEVEPVNNSYYQRKKLLINNISWHIESCPRDEFKVTEYVDLRKLFDIPYEIQSIKLEDAILGTSLIALRLTKSPYKHKGRIYWYDLNTLKQVSTAEVKKARK
jgi:hypothetical protein